MNTLRETPQLAAWRGELGDAYTDRVGATPERVHAAARWWARILTSLGGERPESILEVGANVGINLRALASLTEARLIAVEPNARARRRLVADEVVPPDRVLDGTASSIPLTSGSVDLAFTSGVLIHVPPEALPEALAEIRRVARRWVLAIEYFAVHPETVLYQGRDGLLFKRDFGRLWLEHHPDLRIVDSGFFWKPQWGADDVTWWLFATS
jgi:pseudaminic acid biosynthesis-associated methylase